MQLSSIMPPAGKQQLKKPVRLCDISVHKDSLHIEALLGHIRLFERTRMVGSQPRDETGIYLHIKLSVHGVVTIFLSKENINFLFGTTDL